MPTLHHCVANITQQQPPSSLIQGIKSVPSSVWCSVRPHYRLPYNNAGHVCVPLRMMLVHSVVRYNDSSTMLERERITQVHYYSTWHGMARHKMPSSARYQIEMSHTQVILVGNFLHSMSKKDPNCEIIIGHGHYVQMGRQSLGVDVFNANST